MLPLASFILKWSIRIVIAIVVIIATIILVRAFDSLRLPELSNWHRPLMNSEFTSQARESFKSFEGFQKLENEVFDELDRDVYESHHDQEVLPLSRYSKGSSADPNNLDQNWNRSFELIPDHIRGGVLMIHGLTDSPYSMRHLANLYHSYGYYVLALRMPGHGTVPGELIRATWKDWMAVTTMGVKYVRSKLDDNQPLQVVGYSNGGALAVKYTLDAIEDETLPMPDDLVLLSPMVGVTLFSRFSDWHNILSWMPFFEKFKWLSVLPEFDPFKYNSFPKAAAKQTFLLTRKINTQLVRISKAGLLEQLPPILTFQSLVDATVLTAAIVERLYNRMVVDNSELVLFDVNQLSRVDEFLSTGHNTLYKHITETIDTPYTLTVVTNESNQSTQVVARVRKPQSSTYDIEALDLAWPAKTYSLSHVAIPFPVNDEVYGPWRQDLPGDMINLGSLSPRGERGILTVPIHMLMRLRYNPFYDYMEQRIAQTIE